MSFSERIEKHEFNLDAQSLQVGNFFWFLAITWQLTSKLNYLPELPFSLSFF
jgi:hypothetical protein